MKANGKDYPIYYGKEKMFQTTNQIWYVALKEQKDDIFEHRQVAQEYAGALALALYLLHPWLSAWWTTFVKQMGYPGLPIIPLFC